MLNVIKMDFFRLIKSKYAYCILLVLAGLFIFGTILDSSGDKKNVMEEEQHGISLYAENYNDSYKTIAATKYEYLTSSFSGSNIIPMAIIIFVGLFSGTYYKNRFEKNIIGMIRKREYLVISNLILCAIYCFIIMAMTLVVSLLGYLLFYADFVSIPAGILSDFLRYLLTYYILMISISAAMSCFVQLIKNQVTAVIIGLIYGSGIIYDMIDFTGKSLISQSFSIKNYVPLGLICSLSIQEQEIYLKAIWLGIIFCIGSVSVNILAKNRMDIAT